MVYTRAHTQVYSIRTVQKRSRQTISNGNNTIITQRKNLYLVTERVLKRRCQLKLMFSTQLSCTRPSRKIFIDTVRRGRPSFPFRCLLCVYYTHRATYTFLDNSLHDFFFIPIIERYYYLLSLSRGPYCVVVGTYVSSCRYCAD